MPPMPHNKYMIGVEAMGLFTPKMTSLQLTQVKSLLKQAKESANLVNTTVKPDVFFKRLNFLIDTLMELKKFEVYRIFKGYSPSQNLSDIMADMDKTVCAFIDRSYKKTLLDASFLKTGGAQQAKLRKYFVTMLTAFEMSNDFWGGTNPDLSIGKFEHYTGPLYKPENLEYLHKLRQEYAVDL